MGTIAEGWSSTYRDMVNRNIGLLTEEQQEHLRK